MSFPVPSRNKKGSVEGKFYPLQIQEIIALRELKLLPNALFVHFILRHENPFCDRPIKLSPKEFALKWKIPESSVYEAIGKLKAANIIKINRSKITFEWVHSQQEVNSDNPESVLESQNELRDVRKNSDNPESVLESQNELRDVRKNSDNPESVLESQNELRDVRKNSEMSENQSSKHAPDIRPRSSQTIQTNTDLSQTLSEDPPIPPTDRKRESTPVPKEQTNQVEPGSADNCSENSLGNSLHNSLDSRSESTGKKKTPYQELIEQIQADGNFQKFMNFSDEKFGQFPKPIVDRIAYLSKTSQSGHIRLFDWYAEFLHWKKYSADVVRNNQNIKPKKYITFEEEIAEMSLEQLENKRNDQEHLIEKLKAKIANLPKGFYNPKSFAGKKLPSYQQVLAKAYEELEQLDQKINQFRGEN